MYLMLEYLCEKGHRTESLQERKAPAQGIPCETCYTPAYRTISAVRHRTQWATAATRAKSDPPPAPTALNTIPLAEGMKKSEFRAMRRKVWADRDRARRRAKGAPA